MKAALYDPINGYYCRVDRPRWGREGDYRTSPERSSLFAATFARCFAQFYEDLGRPAYWTIVEAGAGNGQFASGVLRTLQKSFPEVFAATSYVIDEVSLPSRSLAAERLEPFAERIQFKTLAELNIDPGVIFANELLDAFPIHRVIMHDGLLHEFFVDLGPTGNFEWVVQEPSTPRLAQYFDDLGIALVEGQTAEVNLEIEEWLRKVSSKLGAGFVIAVDYGASTADLYSANADQQGTLRGFQRHRFVDDLLAQPGEHDLTTTVNWSFVQAAATRHKFEVVELTRQDKFLPAKGLLEQLEIELRDCDGEAQRLRTSTAVREMILPDGMAASFQVLVLKKSETAQ
jgi:SAM-dependent MidA family methyltransferase